MIDKPPKKPSAKSSSPPTAKPPVKAEKRTEKKPLRNKGAASATHTDPNTTTILVTFDAIAEFVRLKGGGCDSRLLERQFATNIENKRRLKRLLREGGIRGLFERRGNQIFLRVSPEETLAKTPRENLRESSAGKTPPLKTEKTKTSPISPPSFIKAAFQPIDQDLPRTASDMGVTHRRFASATIDHVDNDGYMIAITEGNQSADMVQRKRDSSSLDGNTLPPLGDGVAVMLAPSLETARVSVGEKVLLACIPASDTNAGTKDVRWMGQIVQRLTQEQPPFLAMVKTDRHQTRLIPVDRKMRDSYTCPSLPPEMLDALSDGSIVWAKPLSRPKAEQRLQAQDNYRRKFSDRPPQEKLMAEILEIVTHQNDPRAISLLVLNKYGMTETFPESVEAEANTATIPPVKGREDLRQLPFITIDGADARDFDDAVWAEPDENKAGGFHAIVAIADVAYYVRPGSALDAEAFRRGNSTYFPDRVVPMLPEQLSNNLCSLRPNKPRAVCGFHLWINSSGKLTGHKFFRGLIQSVGRFTYDQVQLVLDALAAETDTAQLPTTLPSTLPLPFDTSAKIIQPLYDVFQALLKAREKRGTLELDIPEFQVRFNEAGAIDQIRPRLRFGAHKLIEELMIAANVAAAETLESRKAPCLYRVHDHPDPTKLEALRLALTNFSFDSSGKAQKPDIPALPKLKQGNITPADLQGILKLVEGTPNAPIFSDLVLRSQAQAAYSPSNIGHFGLALAQYAHFTSPIRRYADLVVHRSLIREFHADAGGMGEGEAERMEATAEMISALERKSVDAEREAMDRYVSQYLEAHIGATFTAKISGVTKFGLFVRLDETGADGLIPMRALDDDFYIFDESRSCLIGRRKNRVLHLGLQVLVELSDANAMTGSCSFRLLDVLQESLWQAPKSDYSNGGNNYRGRSNGNKPLPRKTSKKPADKTAKSKPSRKRK